MDGNAGLVGMSQHCGYCNSKFTYWQLSPQGRRWCPECGAILAEDQRDPEDPI